MTLLVGSAGSYANANLGQVSFEAGYRQDTVDWRQRFPSDDPIVSSNLRFEDLDIFQIGVHGRGTLGNNFYIRGNAYWGWILDGNFKHSFNTSRSPDSYFSPADNLRVGFSDKNRSTVDDKYVFGFGAAIGYPFYLCDCTMVLAPVIGYAFDEQNLHVDDAGFTLEEPQGLIAEGTNGCCNSSFISRWYGPFVGLDFDWRPCNSCFNVWAELEYHWGSFTGRRSHFDNFVFDEGNRRSHSASAWVFGAGFEYDLSSCWTVGVSVKYQDWSSSRHHKICTKDLDTEYLSLCDNRSRTNQKWRSGAINVTFGREF
jgi:opacity protein-like surface antigen